MPLTAVMISPWCDNADLQIKGQGVADYSQKDSSEKGTDCFSFAEKEDCLAPTSLVLAIGELRPPRVHRGGASQDDLSGFEAGYHLPESNREGFGLYSPPPSAILADSSASGRAKRPRSRSSRKTVSASRI